MGGAWRLGWTPVECGSAHPEGTGSWTAPNEASVARARLDRMGAAVGPLDPPTGHRDSCAVLMTSPLSGSCQGNRALGLGPQGRPAGWGSSDSSCLAAPATYLPEDRRGPAASSGGACWAERWEPPLPACVRGQTERETDCPGREDGDQRRERVHSRCTDCMTPAALKRLPEPLLVVVVVVAAAVVVVVVHHGRAHCTPTRAVLMEDNRLPQDVCNSTQGRERGN